MVPVSSDHTWSDCLSTNTPTTRLSTSTSLTYAGNLANLKDVEDKPNYKFVKMDICDFTDFRKAH